MKKIIFSLILFTASTLFSKTYAQCETQSFDYGVINFHLTECKRTNGKPTITGTFEIFEVKAGEVKFKWEGKYKRYAGQVKYNYMGIELLYYPETSEVRYKRMWQDTGEPYHWHQQKGSEFLFKF